MIQYNRTILLILLVFCIPAACLAADRLPSLDTVNGVILLFSGLIGGLGLFLMGIRIMSDSLTKSTGDQIRRLLARFTQNRVVAFFIGIFTTMVFQSSSATTVMLVSFVNSRLIRFANTVAIILGAAIGATLTVQIIAFRLTDYALLVIAIGFLGYIASGKQISRGISTAVIGFGLLFLGMKLMSQSMEPLKSSEIVTGVLLRLEDPVPAILAGALLTALMQSSSAFIGILIILAGQGLISLSVSIPLLVGANIGTAITALLAAVGTTRESKQVALAHTLFKVIGALLIIGWIPPFVGFIVSLTPGNPATLAGNPFDIVPRQIANAHTIFNALIALLFLPFSGMYARLIGRILPLREEKHGSLTSWYLDESLLHTPTLAIGVARQEVLRMMEIVQRMTEEIILPFMERKNSVLSRIQEREKEIDYLRDAINNYLVRVVRQDVTSREVEEAFQMMQAVDEMEQIGDIIAVSLHNKAERWCGEGHNFSAQGREEILDFHLKTMKLLYMTYQAFSDSDLKGARKGARKSTHSYNNFRNSFFDLEKQHYERLKMEVEESLETSRTHLEIISALKVIGSHAANIARIMIKEQKNAG
jgi:phosphate:Na+ symporter